MDVDQHENLPLASALLPKALRAPVGIIYQVVRTAADIVEERDWCVVAARTLTMQLSRRAGVAARSIEGHA